MATKEEIRVWTLEAVRRESGPRNFSAHASSLSDLEMWVKAKLQQSGDMPDGVHGYHSQMPESIKTEIREIVWELAFQGIIVPGGSTNDASLPFFQVTEWGKKCLEAGEYLPFEAGQYLERLKQRIPSVDKSVVLYLRDALLSFRAGAYLSAAVMTGVASEKTLVLLRDAVHGALSSQIQAIFDAKTKGKTAKQTFDEVWKRLDPHHDVMAASLDKEDVKVELAGNFDVIRKTRNDAGHPTGREITREEAYNLLLLFPQYCEATYAAIEWLGKNPL